MTSSTDSLETAGLMRRLVALVYDALIVVAILILASAIGVGVASLIVGAKAVSEDQVLIENPLFFFWLLACWFYYFYYCWKTTGQTLAMKTWRLKLVTSDETEVTLKQALIRFLTALGGLSNLTALLPGRWTLHDSLSGTRIVILPKGK